MMEENLVPHFQKLPAHEVVLFNNKLQEKYGETENRANFRITWSEDEFENRITGYDDKGNPLLVPQVRLLPKYRQWIDNKYVLERLTVVPQIQQNDLTTLLSYEPIWVFEDRHGNRQLPTLRGIIFIIDNLLEKLEHPVDTKYVNPEDDPKEGAEIREARLKQLEKDLFGNETNVGDALAHKEGIIVPRNFGENNGC